MSQNIINIPVSKHTFSGNTFTLISILGNVFKDISTKRKIKNSNSVKKDLWILEN